MTVQLTSEFQGVSEDHNSATKFLYSPFSKIDLQNGGFEILICEIDRLPRHDDVKVRVDWAVIAP